MIKTDETIRKEFENLIESYKITDSSNEEDIKSFLDKISNWLIENIPKITTIILVNNIAFLLLKSCINVCEKSDEAVKRVVSAEEITADNKPKYKKIEVTLFNFFSAIISNIELLLFISPKNFAP